MLTFRLQSKDNYKALITLGVPIVIGQIGNIILGFADTLMVGHHSMTELAAASFVNNVFMLFVILSMGFSYGLTPLVGHRFGRGEYDEIGPLMRRGLQANMLMAVILLVALFVIYGCLGYLGQPEELLPLMRPYLMVNILSVPFIIGLNTFKQFFDAIGHTRIPMCILLFGNVLNILGNYLLIYGAWGFPEWGLFGAGLSTAISRVVMACLAAGIFFFLRRYRRFSQAFLHDKAPKGLFRHINAMSWPLAAQMGMETAAFSLSAILIGWVGTTALAAHQIMIAVSQTCYMVYYGMAAAVAVRVSYFHGQNDLRAVSSTAAAGFQIILAIAFIVCIPIFLFRHYIGGWFTDDAQVSLLVAETIVPLLVYQFGDGLQCTYANALRGISYIKPMMFVAFFSYFIVSLPLSWFLGIHLGYGLVGVWSAFPVCLTCAGVLYYACFRRRLRAEGLKQ